MSTLTRKDVTEMFGRLENVVIAKIIGTTTRRTVAIDPYRTSQLRIATHVIPCKVARGMSSQVGEPSHDPSHRYVTDDSG